MPSLRLAPLPLIAAVVSVLCLAGALAAFLVYPVSAQSEDEPLTAGFLADTRPSNHEGETLGHYNAEELGEHLEEMLDDGSFQATAEGVWVTHEDVNPATGEVEDKHFWLVEHDGLVFGSGWHHDESGG